MKKNLDKETVEVGKVCLDSELEKYGGEVTLTGYLNIQDSRNIIKVSDPFFKEILKIRSEENNEQKIISDHHLQSSPLWYNSLIRVEKRPVLFKRLVPLIIKVKHLMDGSGKFLLLTPSHCLPKHTTCQPEL